MKFATREPLTRHIVAMTLAFASFQSQAEPVITGVSGPLSHGESITITGTGFGTKSPAKPVFWADFESGTLGQSVDGHKPAIGPQLSLDHVGGSALPGTFTNSNSPPTRSRMHAYLDGNPDGGNWILRLRLPISRTEGDQLYYRFWLKVLYPNGWNEQLNHKPVHIFDSSYHDPLYTGFADAGGYRSGGTSSSPTMWAALNIKDIQGQWINYEEEVRLGVSPNGSRRHWIHRESGITEMWNSGSMNTWKSGADYAWFTVGSYFRSGPVEFWVDDIYVDYTFARVEIGNAPTYDASTRRAIQIPSAWSTNSISVTLNQGALPDFQSAYLYVIDSKGAVNAKGFPLACPSCPAAPELAVE